jgi:hypothetical protein
LSNTIAIIKKPKLFYNSYIYKARVNVLDAHFLQYSKDEEDLLKRIDRHHQWAMTFNRSTFRPYKEQDFKNLARLIAYIEKNKDTVKIRFDYHSLSVFSNDLSTLLELDKILDAEVKYTQIVLEGDPTIKLMRDPKHSTRVYFKSKVVTSDFIEDLREFLIRYNNVAFPSGALKKWAYISDHRNWRQKYLDSSYFIDYDQESFSTILNLTFDRFLGKTYKLVKK